MHMCPWFEVEDPEDDASLLVFISLGDGERRTIVGEWAVHFHGSYIRAGRVSDQLYNVFESRAGVLSRTTGTPEELAARCAEWFEAVLSRPVARTELCPFEPAPVTTAGGGPSLIPAWLWRGGGGPGRR
ncbi:hypothetical protein [Streptomyces venezuelae]|uniref:Uncharacterized protein n=1 Tax=Streptomyces venezuelae TaxID=54571 RepID=A0A5P2B859_STRVZ|nr:hypothetical protein [Streptomyces venezuelae]QES25381.1 hypothetical protein DEJ47_01935 [Streptomyces venezuelae]